MMIFNETNKDEHLRELNNFIDYLKNNQIDISFSTDCFPCDEDYCDVSHTISLLSYEKNLEYITIENK